jgi:exopolyphosphatase/guanosine-5'-triphosphate,3'-diphosphate pyrophosphatase
VILLDEVLRRLGADDITLCDLSLREGVVLDYIARHRQEIAQADRYPDVRRRSVYELAERCHYWPGALAVRSRGSRWPCSTRRAPSTGLSDREREWLEYAALLHDIGALISYEQHHKHSYYLIKNGDLRGFEPDEIETIALIARYHRQATPKRTHDSFGDLKRRKRRRVRALAAMLRLAESLDRSHAQSIAGVALRDRGDDDLLQLGRQGDAELELWSAARQAQPFERLTGKPLRLEVSRAPSDLTIRTGDGPTDGTHGHAEQPRTTARISRQALRGGRNRRVGQDDAAGAAGEMAGGRGSQGVRHRMELVRPRQGRHEDRQEEERPDTDDVQPAARHRLR